MVNTVMLTNDNLKLTNGAYNGTIMRSATFGGVLFNVTSGPPTLEYVTIDGNNGAISANSSLST